MILTLQFNLFFVLGSVSGLSICNSPISTLLRVSVALCRHSDGGGCISEWTQLLVVFGIRITMPCVGKCSFSSVRASTRYSFVHAQVQRNWDPEFQSRNQNFSQGVGADPENRDLMLSGFPVLILPRSGSIQRCPRIEQNSERSQKVHRIHQRKRSFVDKKD